MQKLPFILSVLLFSLPVLAADTASSSKPAAKSSTAVYGYQLMTPEERSEYQAKMRGAKTPEERQKICEDHHAQMQTRAKDKGLTLPDRPRCGAGRGMGQRGGGRGGMGGPGRGQGGMNKNPVSPPPASQ